MRPPEFTGGNSPYWRQATPVLRSFNEAAGIHRRKPLPASPFRRTISLCFNEAAGIHRRKPAAGGRHERRAGSGFNEAAGIHRRKRCTDLKRSGGYLLASMRPPEFTGGNVDRHPGGTGVLRPASMRPPEFTGGNCGPARRSRSTWASFNEAAGIHRRKLLRRPKLCKALAALQ